MRARVCESSFLVHTVLELAGDFDLSARPLFPQLRRAALAAPPARLVLDLSQVTFLDCGTVRELLTVVGCVAPGTPTVCPEGPALRLLRMTGYTPAHRVVPTLVEATLPRAPELTDSP